jgi:hypothetical protein
MCVTFSLSPLRLHAHPSAQTLETTRSLPGSGPVTLRIVAQPDSYTLAYQTSAQIDPVVLGTLSTAVLERSRPIDSPYTGTHFGVFAQGSEGFFCQDSAYFSYASFEP